MYEINDLPEEWQKYVLQQGTRGDDRQWRGVELGVGFGVFLIGVLLILQGHTIAGWVVLGFAGSLTVTFLLYGVLGLLGRCDSSSSTKLSRQQLAEVIERVEKDLADKEGPVLERIGVVITKATEARKRFESNLKYWVEPNDYLALSRREVAKNNLVPVNDLIAAMIEERRKVDEASKETKKVLKNLKLHFQAMADMDSTVQGIILLKEAEEEATAVMASVKQLCEQYQVAATNLQQISVSVNCKVAACAELQCNPEGKSLTIDA